MEVFIVEENNGEEWEDNHSWPVAVFDSLEKATEYVQKAQIKYDAEWDIRKANGDRSNEEYENMRAAIPYERIKEYMEITEDIYKYVEQKYPNTVDSWDNKHYFQVVHQALPFNPTF